MAAPVAPRPLPARRAALEIAGATAVLALMIFAWTRWSSWLERLQEFQVTALVGFGALAVVLARAPRYAALSRPGLWVILVAIVLRGALWPVVPSLSDDIYRYVWEGRVALAGHDPYALPPRDERLVPLRDETIYPRINHPELSTIYPPLGVAQFALVAAVWPTVAGMKAWVILCDLAIVWTLVAWLERRRLPVLWAAAYAWNPLVLAEYAGSGHNDPCAILGLVLALAWAERRPVASAAALAVGAMTKLAPLLALPFLMRVWPVRARVLAASVIGIGLACYAAWTRGAASGLSAYWQHWQNNDLVFHFVERWTGSFLAAHGVTALALAALIVALLARKAPAEAASRAAVRAGLVMGPVAHPWYFGWPLALEPLGPSWPWLLLSMLSLFSYGILRAPAEGTNAHLALGWRCLEYGAPLALALLLWLMRRKRAPR